MEFGVNIPFVHHLGFELVRFGDGESEIHYDPKPEHLNSFLQIEPSVSPRWGRFSPTTCLS